MTHQRLFFASLFLVVFSVAAGRDAAASDYVWARTNWGSSNINGRYGSMSNGYGGYCVPRTAYGNNYESQGNFTNPNGYIVPAQSTQVQQSAQPQGSHFQRIGRKHRRR